MLVNTICPACSKAFQVQDFRLNNVGVTQPNMPCCSRKCAASFRTRAAKHGHCKDGHSKEFRAWHNMKVRCYFKTSERYHRYGGRGITVCDRWRKSFENFLADVGYAPSPAHTLGRINNNGNYEPGNVEWQSVKEQCNNRETSRHITAFGRTQTLQQWSDETGLGHTAITTRVDRLGWDTERALSASKAGSPRPYGPKRMIEFRGETKTLAEWGRITGIPSRTIARRLDGFSWPVAKALTVNNRDYHDGPKIKSEH